MYKIFSGEKCIIISSETIKDTGKDIKVISFQSSEALHKEYKQFMNASKLKNLIITGEEKKTWTVFRSLFVIIEAAGGLVKNGKEELLMIYRNKHWDLPKGKMEKGETPAETAVREVEEECGLKNLKIVKPLTSTYHIFSQKNKDCIKQTYWFEMTCKDPEKLTPQTEEGIEEVKWMSKEEAKKVEKETYSSLSEIISITFF